MTARIEIFHQKVRKNTRWNRSGHRTFGLWYWRLRSANGRIVADGAEGYATKGNARRAADRVESIFQGVVL